MVLPENAVAPPVVTPFDDEGAVDADALAAVTEHCVDAGLDGVVPCGTTGEFASLTIDEWETVVETTVETADGVPVVAGAADTTVAGATERLECAADAGADAGLVTEPYFHRANDPAGAEAFLRRVADESPLPIYLYDIPSCTGGPIAHEAVTALATHENVVGMKDSSGDAGRFFRRIRETPADFDMLQGFDDQTVPTLAFGAAGAINAVSQVLPEAYLAARDAVVEGDLTEARRINEAAIAPVFDVSAEHGFAPATKAGLVARGVLDDDAVRPPLVSVDDDVADEVAEVVEAALAAV